jgi:hypothetical protein
MKEIKTMKDEYSQKPSTPSPALAEKLERIERAISRVQSGSPSIPPPPPPPEKVILKEHVHVLPQPATFNPSQKFCTTKFRVLTFRCGWRRRNF